MSNTNQLRVYPLDLTGGKPENKVTERQTLSHPARTDFNIMIPNYAPFFIDSLTVKKVETAEILVFGRDYYIGTIFEGITAYTAHQQIVGATIIFLDQWVGGTYEITYQTLGGEYTTNPTRILESLVRNNSNPFSTTWENITNKPINYPVGHHGHQAEELTNYGDMINALEQIGLKLEQYLLDQNHSTLPNYNQLILTLIRQGTHLNQLATRIDDINATLSRTSAGQSDSLRDEVNLLKTALQSLREQATSQLTLELGNLREQLNGELEPRLVGVETKNTEQDNRLTSIEESNVEKATKVELNEKVTELNSQLTEKSTDLTDKINAVKNQLSTTINDLRNQLNLVGDRFAQYVRKSGDVMTGTLTTTKVVTPVITSFNSHTDPVKINDVFDVYRNSGGIWHSQIGSILKTILSIKKTLRFFPHNTNNFSNVQNTGALHYYNNEFIFSQHDGSGALTTVNLRVEGDVLGSGGDRLSNKLNRSGDVVQGSLPSRPYYRTQLSDDAQYHSGFFINGSISDNGHRRVNREIFIGNTNNNLNNARSIAFFDDDVNHVALGKWDNRGRYLGTIDILTTAHITGNYNDKLENKVYHAKLVNQKIEELRSQITNSVNGSISNLTNQSNVTDQRQQSEISALKTRMSTAENKFNDYVRKSGDTMAGRLTITDRLVTQKIGDESSNNWIDFFFKADRGSTFYSGSTSDGNMIFALRGDGIHARRALYLQDRNLILRNGRDGETALRHYSGTIKDRTVKALDVTVRNYGADALSLVHSSAQFSMVRAKDFYSTDDNSFLTDKLNKSGNQTYDGHIKMKTQSGSNTPLTLINAQGGNNSVVNIRFRTDVAEANMGVLQFRNAGYRSEFHVYTIPTAGTNTWGVEDRVMSVVEGNLWVKNYGYLHDRFMPKTQDDWVKKNGTSTMTGDLHILGSNNYSAVKLRNRNTHEFTVESRPHTDNYFGNLLYRNYNTGSILYKLELPKKSGEVAVVENGILSVNRIETTSNNAGGINIKIGDDAYLGDDGIASTIKIKSTSNANVGYIAFGNQRDGLGWNGSDLVYGNKRVLLEDMDHLSMSRNDFGILRFKIPNKNTRGQFEYWGGDDTGQAFWKLWTDNRGEVRIPIKGKTQAGADINGAGGYDQVLTDSRFYQWEGNTPHPVETDLKQKQGICYVLFSYRQKDQWQSFPILKSHNTYIGYNSYGGENSDRNYSSLVKIENVRGTIYRFTPMNAVNNDHYRVYIKGIYVF